MHVFPSYLEPSRTSVIDALGTDQSEIGRLLSCRGYRSGCESILCPACTRRTAHRLSKRVLQVASTRPLSHLRKAVFKIPDFELYGTRDIVHVMLESAKKLSTLLPIRGMFTRAEVSLDEWSGLAHPHLHTLFESRVMSGTNYISANTLTDAWQSVLPPDLRRSDSVHIDRLHSMQSLRKTSKYITKSAFQPWHSESEVAFSVAATMELKGMQRHRNTGSLKWLNSHQHLATYLESI